MESIFSRYKNVLVLIVVLAAQVVGLAVQVRRPVQGALETEQVRLIRYWVVSLITPPERWIHATSSGARWMWSNYAYLRGVRKQNRDLKAEVERLRIEQAGLLDDARQGQRLQQLLSFKQHYVYATQPAQIIGTSGSDLSHVLYLDKGSRDGIKADMPVITPDGIVGKIKDVFPHTAQALLISDQMSGAGVLLETSRIRGVLRGNSLGQPEIVDIAPDEQIKAGDRILTSGGDGVFPRGLPVGVVTGTRPDPEHDGYVSILVRTAANLARLEEVLVITSVHEQMAPLEQQDMAQSAMEAQKRAAEILSERLPGLKDPNAPAVAAGAPVEAAGDPGRPPRPGLALHPDRFSPGGSTSARVGVPLARTAPVASGLPAVPVPRARVAAPAVRTAPAVGEAAAPARILAPVLAPGLTPGETARPLARAANPGGIGAVPSPKIRSATGTPGNAGAGSTRPAATAGGTTRATTAGAIPTAARTAPNTRTNVPATAGTGIKTGTTTENPATTRPKVVPNEIPNAAVQTAYPSRLPAGAWVGSGAPRKPTVVLPNGTILRPSTSPEAQSPLTTKEAKSPLTNKEAKSPLTNKEAKSPLTIKGAKSALTTNPVKTNRPTQSGSTPSTATPQTKPSSTTPKPLAGQPKTIQAKPAQNKPQQTPRQTTVPSDAPPPGGSQ